MAVKLKMPSISFVVARSEPGHVIGCDNRLPWHLRSDLRNFKKITTDHVVVMGRKTFDSIGKPLPNRTNIVMSSQVPGEFPNVYFADTKDSALYFADLFSVMNGSKDIFVIGGGKVYEEFKGIFNKVYLTEVYAKNIQGDAFFDYKFDSKRWALIEEARFDSSPIDEFPFAIKTYRKRGFRKNRDRLLSAFLKPDENLKEWELKQLSQVKLPKPDSNILKTIQLELPNVTR